MPERAEIEAGIEVLRAMLGDVLGTDEEVRDMALGVLLGAERVRDARGDDEAAPREAATIRRWKQRALEAEADLERLRSARPPQGEDVKVEGEAMLARSPQDVSDEGGNQ